MFDLRQADGIGGGQSLSVKRCREEFERLVAGVTQRLDLRVDASGVTATTVEQLTKTLLSVAPPAPLESAASFNIRPPS